MIKFELNAIDRDYLKAYIELNGIRDNNDNLVGVNVACFSIITSWISEQRTE